MNIAGIIGVIVLDIVLGALIGWVASKILHTQETFWKNVWAGIGGMIFANVILNQIKVSNIVVQVLVSVLFAVCIIIAMNKKKH